MRKFILLSVLSFTMCLPGPLAFAGGGHEHGHGHGHGHEVEPAKGPHGGKLLVDGDFSLEITIFERGVPPQFRVFAHRDGEQLNTDAIHANIELERFGGQREVFELKSTGEFLTSEKTVEEPHSFLVTVQAQVSGKSFEWNYDSYEGRTTLSEDALRIADLSIEVAGPQDISTVSNVYGRLLPSQNRVMHVVPRFPGVVREITKDLGERVNKGDLLAVIESNQSLREYEIRSPISGEIIARHATVGEFVTDTAEILVVADLTEIWADFQIYRDRFDQIEKGQIISVDLGLGENFEATIKYVSPVIDEATQSKLIRAVLPNPSGKLRPGLFVSGSLLSAKTKVPLAVKREAIQTFRDWSVVYLTDGSVFQAMPVELGRQDSTYIEILSGISPGDRYVARNSFIIKADVEKSGASHDH